MECFGGGGFSDEGCVARKKRSVVSHKPRQDPLTFSERSDILRSVVIPVGQESHDEEKLLEPDAVQSEKRPKRLKLKLRGVTHTIQTNSRVDSYPSDDHILQPKPLLQDGKRKYALNSDSDLKKVYALKGEISAETFHEDEKSSRKSKRIHERSVSDVGLSEDGNDDDEIRFVEKLNASKASKRSQKDSDYVGDIGNYNLPRLQKHSGKKSRSEKMSEDRDYLGGEEEEELTSDDELQSNRRTLKRGSLSLLLEAPQNSTPTTRNRALQSGIDVLPGFDSSILANPSSSKKEKVSDVDRQSKKAEAAQRRKIQTEKMAREAEAEAIRKILGQDSKKKKKDEELRQKRDGLSQARNASDVPLGPNTVRWMNGPKGTVVQFSDDIGLPNIFSPMLCSYPPPREKCAGPDCTNAYKYRDSKSKLPLCSLHCYKALNVPWVDPLGEASFNTLGISRLGGTFGTCSTIILSAAGLGSSSPTGVASISSPEVDYTVAMSAYWPIETVYQESFAHCLEEGSKTPPELQEVCQRLGSDGFGSYSNALRSIADWLLLKASDDVVHKAEVAFMRVLEHEVEFWNMSRGIPE